MLEGGRHFLPLGRVLTPFGSEDCAAGKPGEYGLCGKRTVEVLRVAIVDDFGSLGCCDQKPLAV
jgi:hypothetical protein